MMTPGENERERKGGGIRWWEKLAGFPGKKGKDGEEVLRKCRLRVPASRVPHSLFSFICPLSFCRSLFLSLSLSFSRGAVGTNREGDRTRYHWQRVAFPYSTQHVSPFPTPSETFPFHLCLPFRRRVATGNAGRRREARTGGMDDAHEIALISIYEREPNVECVGSVVYALLLSGRARQSASVSRPFFQCFHDGRMLNQTQHFFTRIFQMVAVVRIRTENILKINIEYTYWTLNHA